MHGGFYQILAAWGCVELAYYAWHRGRYGVLNQLVETEYDVERVAEVKRRFLQLKGCMSIEDFFSGWFHGVPAEEVRRGNVEDFVAYGFYFRRLEALPPQLQRAVAEFVDQIELEWGVKFSEGRNSEIGFMAHVWEDLRVLPKPLALHLVCELVSALATALLWQMGFRMDTCHGFTYWIRRPDQAAAGSPRQTGAEGVLVGDESGVESCDDSPVDTPSVSGRSSVDIDVDASLQDRDARTFMMGMGRAGVHRRGDSCSSLRSEEGGDISDPGPRPVFFLHGVGLGMVPYLGLIYQTAVACPRSPIILLEAPHVGLRLQLRAREVDEVANAAAAILWRHGFPEACFVAHSYGTFCASRITQLHRSVVHSLALVDPVCFLTCYPQLLYNFVYRVPKLSDALGSLAGLVATARFIFSRDLIIAETFCRKFRWHELILWPEDMPAHALVALSDKDDLVPSPLVAKHISDAHPTATVMYHPTAGHGGFLIDIPWQRSLVQGIKRLAELPSEASLLASSARAKLQRKLKTIC
ncbi:hypothetical protein COCOBI_14-0620 [Coccomyxa sp. Obi]|nr:hypothetical protein COCOBI_14-0620 [Coccomyxa sp. Obi]